jgi:acyl-CoA thioesterase-1
MSALFQNFIQTTRHCTKPTLALGIKVLSLCAVVLVAWPLVAAAQLKVTPGMKDSLQTSSVFKDTVLVVGDSLSAEYGLKRGTGWVPLLDKQITQDKKSAKVINASISGDTTSGGRSRLLALLAQHKPSVVVIELGGNDALRGLPLDMTEKNLLEMTQLSKKAGAKVLIVGMQVPPNYGGAYGATFAALFAKVAKAEKVSLVPFFLKGIADVQDSLIRFQADRIHPNEGSQPAMLANVWPELKKLLK